MKFMVFLSAVGGSNMQSSSAFSVERVETCSSEGDLHRFEFTETYNIRRESVRRCANRCFDALQCKKVRESNAQNDNGKALSNESQTGEVSKPVIFVPRSGRCFHPEEQKRQTGTRNKETSNQC